MRTIVRVKSRITIRTSLYWAIVLPVILVEATILLLKQMSTFLLAAGKYDKLLAQLVKGHKSFSILSVPVHSIKRIAKDLCFTTIDNLTTIIEVQQVKGTATKKERGKLRVVSIRSVHYLVAFAPAAGELIIFTAAGC